MPNSLDLNPDIAVGIQFPLQNSNGGYFNQSYTTIDQVKSNIRNLLLTTKGERLFQPGLGSDLMNIVFEPINDSTVDLITETIKDAISQWLPFVTVANIKTQISDTTSDKNMINVDIVFYLGNDSNLTETVNLNFETVG
tara:strand:- start:35 stop:451 length:417 start_codon:yes stop_codon:yes gene_type:complete